MSTYDMFKGEFTVPPGESKTPGVNKTTMPKGYAADPGSGPDGFTCRQCKHYIIKYTQAGYTHPKCGLMRHRWTNGRGSDIKVSSPCCKKFEKELKQ